MTQIVLEWETTNGKRRQKINDVQKVTIGRHPGCDIVLGDPHVSRRHASISFSNDSFHLHNHSQTNPIIFNDRWSLSHDLKADLEPGDTFTIGTVRMKVGFPIHPSNGHGSNGHSEALQCPTCGRAMPDRRATCPLCRVSIEQVETVLVSQDL